MITTYRKELKLEENQRKPKRNKLGIHISWEQQWNRYRKFCQTAAIRNYEMFHYIQKKNQKKEDMDNMH